MSSHPSDIPDCSQHPDEHIEESSREDAILELIEMSKLSLPSSDTDAQPDEENMCIVLAKQAVEYSDGCEDSVLARACIQLGYSYSACKMWEEAAAALQAARAMQQDVWTAREQEQLTECFWQIKQRRR